MQGVIQKKMLAALVAFLLLGVSSSAQEKGIVFESGLTWIQVLAKAKKENKPIFVDCYATWCGPCKKMEASVYTNPEVGEFYNSHFINVKLQLDTTARDNEAVQMLYADAATIAKKYEVKALPTFLVFSPEGKAWHRFTGAVSAPTFIEKAKAALEPSQQYYTVLYNIPCMAGDSAAMLHAIKIMQVAKDEKAVTMAGNAYVKTLKAPYASQNLPLILGLVSNTKSVAFQLVSGKPEPFIAAFGKKKVNGKIINSIFLDELWPVMEKTTMPQWGEWETLVAKKYPAYAHQLILMSKMKYYRVTKKSEGYITSLIAYMNEYKADESDDNINSYAWEVFEQNNDSGTLIAAADWLKVRLQQGRNDPKLHPMMLDTYANLLYKAGKVEEAISWEKKALDALPESKLYKQTLTTMQNGKPTWPVK